MKSKDLQQVVLSKAKKGEAPKKIFSDLDGAVSYRSIERWCRMVRETGVIDLLHPPGRQRTIRTKSAIQKVKRKLKNRKAVSCRKLALEMHMSSASAYRILKDDLQLRAYKKLVEPLLSDEHKVKRKKFANWVRQHFRKEDTLRFVFSDEKMFDLDGIYNSQNDRIWAVDRAEANRKGGVKQRRKFPQKVMVWLAACSEGVSPLVVFKDGTVDHDRYIREVLPVALKYGNKVFGDNWTFQQDGAKPHTHKKSQQWCMDNFPGFIDRDTWPPNSPDLNPLDYCIWDEFGKAIKWEKVTSKTTLIGELKRAVKKIRIDVVRESCVTWTNRLYRLVQNDGNYLRE
jgi:hypothetical protein